MRILHIVESLTSESGGLSRAVAGLAGQMARLGHEVEILTTAPGFEESLQSSGVTVRVFRRGPLAGWSYATGLSPAIKSGIDRADLAHVHGLWLYPQFVAARASHHVGKPYVVSPHGMLDPWALNHKRLKKRIYGKLIEWRNLRRAAAIHAVTESEVEDIHRLGLDVPTFVVPNGIDTEELSILPHRSNLASRFPQLAGKTVILFLGRIHPKKGLDLLAKAFVEVAAKRSNVSLVIAGPDEVGYWQKMVPYPPALDTFFESVARPVLVCGLGY